MALRQLMLGKKIDDMRAQMDALNATRDALAERRAALDVREAELEAAISEVNEETTKEDRDALDAMTSAWEADDAALSGEEDANTQARAELEAQIAQMQAELDALNARARNAGTDKTTEKRGDMDRMDMRTMYTGRANALGMDMQQREAFFARDDVKEFLTQVREMGKHTRAVTGGGVLVPYVVMDVLRQTITRYSKLYEHVRVRQVGGTGRQPITGPYVEAIWTEQCAKLNEIGVSFSAFEFDGYKVGAFISVCNALLDDTDPVLGQEIIIALGQGIGLALDKAILYGTGTKMPLGILTRLAQATQPEDYPATARAWENLSATHVTAITSKTGIELFQAIVTAAGVAKSDYSAGGKFWAMNEATYNKLIAEAMSINGAGAIVTGMQDTMPVIGGAVEKLSFMPDDVIIGGYGDLYLLVERAGTQIEQSREVRFIEDETVFRGTARYDGQPMIAEGFVAIGIGGTAPSATAVTFTPASA